MQVIQDQQHAILTAVLPLLPLVQAFPLHLDQAKASIADQVKTTTAENISSSMSCLSSDIDSMKSTLSSISAFSNSARIVPKPALDIQPSRSEHHPTRKRTNSWLSQDSIHLGRSQSTRSHSFAPLHSPRIDRYKKPRLGGVSPTGSPQLARQSSHPAKSPKEDALHLCKSLHAVGLTSLTGGTATNTNNHSAASWPERTSRTPLAGTLLPAPVNHTDLQSRMHTTEPSCSVPGAIFSVNAQTMQASPQSRRHPVLSARAQMIIPTPSTTVPIIPNISTAAPEPDDSVVPIINQKGRKMIPESVPDVPPTTPRPISKAIKLEEALRSPIKGYISITSSPLSSLSPSPPQAPLKPNLKAQAQHIAGGTAQRQVVFATSSQVLPRVPLVSTPESASASMSLRDRRAQMFVVSTSAPLWTIGFTGASKLGRTTSSAKRFIALGSSSDEEG